MGITQAQLAERVNTSTNYIALIETGKKFPKPEMLERIAAALKIEPSALFTAEIRFLTETETLVKVQKQMMNGINQVVSYWMKELGQGAPPDDGAGADKDPKLV